MADNSTDLPIRQFIVKIVQIITKPLDWKTLSVLCPTFLLYTWLLPVAERSTKALELISKLAELTGGSLIAWLGWACALALIATGGPYVLYAQRRINQLGEFQRRVRNEQDLIGCHPVTKMFRSATCRATHRM
jgi:hypothetical protein